MNGANVQILTGFLVGASGSALIMIMKFGDRLARIEAKVDVLMRHNGLT